MISELAVPLGLTLAAGLATSVGGLVVLRKAQPSRVFLAAALGLSAGVMLWVSFVELFPEAVDSFTAAYGDSSARLYAGVAFFAGIGLIAIIDRLVPAVVNPHEPVVDGASESTGLAPAALRKMGLVTALAIGIHNFPEGFATFVSGTEDLNIALPIAAAIAIHNIPEGIAVAVPIWQATGSRRKGFWWATIAGLSEPLGALIGALVLLPFLGPATMGVVFAMIAGVMVFVSLDELLPTAVATGKHHAAVYGLVVGMAIMELSLLLFQ
ncbi:zinc transporter ZupT [Corynebacterium incognita]|uniref:Zinc transporter ZupT n=1 Tax=Corynebacterium incognita TaxID=2754725 RepID=A0A7G7CNY1_9CORY|nr:zinc transporter ZupT [Corynebacterium incognita]QNE89297.1 zinc transporter ZupT [Corynebacterium incognita]